ncbi:MAG: L-histidine N(alpha)-methyltransferase [Methylotetracoccus sp.]|jgi:dimethylhistidine N-methyltransferase|nr:L-histidine N(alpha)-methyltransferase [Methylotetracoccus sp.]
MMPSDARRGRVDFIDLAPPPADFGREVTAGLSRPAKALSPKFFYDAEGCRLFEAICEVPEYYLTRAETEILARRACEIAETLGRDLVLIELGSGSSRKTRLLLNALRPHMYMPLDIARDHLAISAASLAAEYPWLEIRAVCVDYSQAFTLPPLQSYARKVAFFPGSSIGNFDPDSAVALLRGVRDAVGRDGGLLIGFDLKKEVEILQRAYNDGQGLTADFNLNLLRRINRELGGDFNVENFRHHAFFNEQRGRIEMHLVSALPQSVEVGGQHFHFDEGESIHTENSYKYSLEDFRAMAVAAGFTPVRNWFDTARRFCVQYLVSGTE